MAKVERPALMQRMFSPDWENIVPFVAGEQGISRACALEWELVLQARHLPCRLRKMVPDGQWGILVQPWFLERAREELRLYLDENKPVPALPVLPPPHPGELWPTTMLLLFLTLFFAWYTTPHPDLNLYASRWLAAGSAHGQAILSGQWWRLVTALTLHADGPHLVGNAVVGGVFIVLACRLLGSGLAWFLVLLAGISGNLLDALVLGPAHDSIGFSTAVFGAAGVLSGVRMAEGRGDGLKRLVPVGAGLGILAMLGAGGGHTDLGAHLFGFLAGLLLGWPCGWLVVRMGRPGRLAGGLLLAGVVGVTVASWFLALQQ